MSNTMKKRKNNPRRHKSSFRSVSAVKKEVELLRDFATRHCEVEFILPMDGGSVRYEGRIIDTTLDDGTIPSFQFTSQSGMQAMLMPQTFPKSSIEKVADMHNGVYVEGKTKGSLGFSIVEVLFGKKPHAKLPSVLEKLRAWERLQLDLHVVLSQGCHAVSFLGQTRELSSGVFSFTKAPAPTQLMIRVEDYKHMNIKVEGDKSDITLIDPRTGEWCLISDAATRPETVFQRFVDISSTVN